MTETESEVLLNLLRPKQITGDTSLEDSYPKIEAQVEQQLTTLSKLSSGELDAMIKSYNKQINYSVKEIADSMMDHSRLTEMDDSTMAMVKMLCNWQAVQEACGEFEGVDEYIVDMSDQIITMSLATKYSDAEKNSTTVSVQFTYDLARNVTLLDWELKEGLFDAKIRKGSDGYMDDSVWSRIYELEERVAELESQLKEN